MWAPLSLVALLGAARLAAASSAYGAELGHGRTLLQTPGNQGVCRNANWYAYGYCSIGTTASQDKLDSCINNFLVCCNWLKAGQSWRTYYAGGFSGYQGGGGGGGAAQAVNGTRSPNAARAPGAAPGGQVVNANGQVVNANGQVVNANGQVVNSNGQAVPTPVTVATPQANQAFIGATPPAESPREARRADRDRSAAPSPRDSRRTETPTPTPTQTVTVEIPTVNGTTNATVAVNSTDLTTPSPTPGNQPRLLTPAPTIPYGRGFYPGSGGSLGGGSGSLSGRHLLQEVANGAPALTGGAGRAAATPAANVAANGRAANGTAAPPPTPPSSNGQSTQCFAQFWQTYPWKQ